MLLHGLVNRIHFQGFQRFPEDLDNCGPVVTFQDDFVVPKPLDVFDELVDGVSVLFDVLLLDNVAENAS